MGALRVAWAPDALDDWRRLALTDAKAVAAAVDQFAEFGEGVAVDVDGELLVFVGEYVVVLLVGDALQVDRVERA